MCARPDPLSVGADIIRPSFWNRIKFLGMGKGIISPCGAGMEMVSPSGDLLCPCRQSRQNATGDGVSKNTSCFYAASPGPPFVYGGATKGRDDIQPAREKDRIPFLAPPAAAPCWLNRLMLLQEQSRLAFFHRVAVRWSVLLRGWSRIRKIAVNTHLLQVRTRQRFR